MSSDADAILNAALALPSDLRAALAEKLLESLDSPDQSEIDAAWVAEAEKRIQAHDEGASKAIPVEAVFRSLLPKGPAR